MGISGLLPFVKKASRPCFLREFSGSVAAVDTYCWLHKGAFSCADKLVRGEDTDGYVVYVMKMVQLLLAHRIKPVMVFDGCNLPSKAGTEAKRRESRAKNRALAAELLRAGRVREARECYQRCVDITSSMARAVMQACRQINVDVIVAPYEADAELAYLVRKGFADLVITEDSDLLLFGAERVLFKLDSVGGAVLVEQSKLHLTMGLPAHKFSMDTFVYMCVLSGCDYLPSLPGIGLGKSCKFFTLTTDTDIYNVLSKLPSYLRMPQLEVSLEYRESFLRAVYTFRHQLVFCPRDRRLRPLTNLQDGSSPSKYSYAGAFIGHERALQIALGNIDIQTGEQVDDYCPDVRRAPSAKSSVDDLALSSSIWHPHYNKQALQDAADLRKTNKKSPTLSAFVCNDTRKREAASRRGDIGSKTLPLTGEKNKTKKNQVKKIVDIKSLFAKRKREQEEDEDQNLQDLMSLYGHSKKTSRRGNDDSVCNSSIVTDSTTVAAGSSPPKSLPVNPFAKFRHIAKKDEKSIDINSSSLISIATRTRGVSDVKQEGAKPAVDDEWGPAGVKDEEDITEDECSKECSERLLDDDGSNHSLLNSSPNLISTPSASYSQEESSDFLENCRLNNSFAKSKSECVETTTSSPRSGLAKRNSLMNLLKNKKIIVKSRFFRPANEAKELNKLTTQSFGRPDSLFQPSTYKEDALTEIGASSHNTDDNTTSSFGSELTTVSKNRDSHIMNSGKLCITEGGNSERDSQTVKDLLNRDTLPASQDSLGLSCKSSVMNDSYDNESFGLTPLDATDNLSQITGSCEASQETANILECSSPERHQGKDCQFVDAKEDDCLLDKRTVINTKGKEAKKDIDIVTNVEGISNESEEILCEYSSVTDIKDILKNTDLTCVQNSPRFSNRNSSLKSFQSTSKSPYFSGADTNATNPGSCRRPGLSRPAKEGRGSGTRQLNLKDMFSLYR